MSTETLVVQALLLAAFVPLLVAARRAGSARAVALCLGLWAATGAFVLFDDRPPERLESAVANRPRAVPDEGFETSDSCRACHPREYATWHASYHRTMTQVATPETVIAPFDDVVLTAFGERYALSRRGDEFWVELPDPAWDGSGVRARVERRIVLTTGFHHEQDFWYEAEEGRKLSHLPFVWRVPEERWVPEAAVFLRPPPEHEERPSPGIWNFNCLKCHTTHGKTGLELDGSGALDTTVTEFGIACEACHGPSAEHARRSQSPLARYRMHLGDGAAEEVTNPSALDRRLEAQVCGQCHSVQGFHDREARVRTLVDGLQYAPGGDLDHSGKYVVRVGDADERPSLAAQLQAEPSFLADRFWPDGEVRISGREYNGLLESPCYADGESERSMTCLSCHAMHQAADDPRPVREWANDQLARGMDGDGACLQCHETIGRDVEAHTHHPAESSGSRCYECHMPYTTFGLLKSIRSHTVTSPSAAATLTTGRPDACNLCHLDRTLAWTAERLGAWYGQPPVELNDVQRSVPMALVMLLAGDAGQRALVACAMERESAREACDEEWFPPFLALLLADPYDAVRFCAGRALAAQRGFEDFRYDYVSSEGERAAARARAEARWRGMRAEAGLSEDLQFLIDAPRGALGADPFGALQRRRDDRRVFLME